MPRGRNPHKVRPPSIRGFEAHPYVMPLRSDATAPRDLVQQVTAYLATAGPRTLLIEGQVGAGKSSLLRALIGSTGVPGLLLLYQQMPEPTEQGSGRSVVSGPTTLLALDLAGTPGAPPAPAPAATGPLAPPPTSSAFPVPGTLLATLARLSGSGGTVFADSWDRDTERYLRGLAPTAESVVTFQLPGSDLPSLQGTLTSMRSNLVLAMVPELALPLQSMADGVIHLARRETPDASYRIATVGKIRGSALDNRDHLYTLDGGTFRALPDLPRGFAPPTAPPEPDPEPAAGSIWPGSAEFAQTFGRLGYGGLTALTIAPDCPDGLGGAVLLPVVAHVLRAGGRVVWTPSPSTRPSRVVALLREHVPTEWLRERLRILSASGDDPGLGELGGVVLPLRREVASGGEMRAATSPGVGPIFPDAHRFLRGTSDPCPAMYVLSVAGLKACTAAAGIQLNPVLLPTVVGAYARLPRFHGIGYGPSDDPLTVATASMMTSTLRLEVVCGRPVLRGTQPRTAAFAMDWTTPDGRYSLLPCN